MILVAYRPTCRQSLRNHSGAEDFEDLSDTIEYNAMEHTTTIVATGSYTTHLLVHHNSSVRDLRSQRGGGRTLDLPQQMLHWVPGCGRKESAFTVFGRFVRNPVCFRGTCHHHISAYQCKCPSGYVSAKENCKSQCRIVVYGIAQPPCLAAGTGPLH